jgi:hypothetical protein
MRAKWAESTSRTFKIPSIRTILLVLLLVGALTAIVCISIGVQNETPQPPAPEAPVTIEGPATWLSAWSTFWGAVATAVGAVLTGGALLIAALTYSRQVADKHQELEDRRKEEARKRKEQADKVIVRVERGGLPNGQTLVDLKNPTNLPIFKMNLYTINDEGQVIDRQPLSQEVVVGDYPGHHFEQSDRVHSAYAEFTDSAGVAWIRTSKGTLVEKGKEPNGFDPREIWQPGDPMHTYMTWD